MNDSRASAWLALADAGLSSGVLARLVASFGGPEEVLAAFDRELAERAGLNADQCRRLRDSSGDRLRRERQLRALAESGQRIVESGDEDWPAMLAEIPDAPPYLFVRGTILPEDRFAVAMVGPRTATPYGLEVARRLATGFVPTLTVVSGMALGIDSAAHEAALKAGGRTIGVAACGLDQDYPQGNARLRERIPESGAMIGLWPPLTKSRTHFFPQRNELVAALSLAVVIVEAGEKSGALITARAAADIGRDVFAVPGDITRANSRGSNRLLAEGAGVCSCPEDVIAALEPYLRDHTVARPEPAEEPPANLPESEAVVLQAIRHTTRTYDDLVAELVPARMTLGEVATALLQLELKGLVRQQPGSVYIPA